MSQRRPARASLSAALAAAMSLLGAVPVALGQAPPPSVTWSAPPECPDEAYVRTAVQQLLGPDDPAAARVEAHARVERMADSTWRVHLTTQRDGATGERVVDATSCRSLADATALIVALAIDPQRVAANRPSVAAAAGSSPSASASAAPSSSSSSAPAPVSASATPLPPTPPPAPTPSPRSAPVASPALALAPTPEPPPAPLPTSRFSVFAALAGDLGTLPRPAYGVTLGAALFPWPALRVEAYGSFWPSQHASSSSSSTPGAGGDFFLADGGARACWLPLHANLEIAACPGLEVGVLHGQGDDITHPSSADSVWFAFTGLGRLTWRVGPSLAFFLDLSLALPPFRDVFQLSGDTIHQAGFVEGRASLGPELRF
jgi:hypothetical protein